MGRWWKWKRDGCFWNLFCHWIHPLPLSTSFPCPEISNISYHPFYRNNINGEIDPCPSWGATVHFGGLARRGTWVKDTREKEKAVLVLNTGDLLFFLPNP
jgi:hypothetical protein